MPTEVLVTGAAGILGDALLRSLRFDGAIGTVHERPSSHESVRLDLRDHAAVGSELARLRPRVIIHTVALTDVDACERDPGSAFATSVATAHNLAMWLAANDPATLLVYVSSDQVYSGAGPHAEERTQPINTYGQSKRAGELAAAQAPRHLVLRTNFFGHSTARPSYTDWIVRTIGGGGSIPVDPRASFSALHLRDLVELFGVCLDRELEGTFNLGAHTGMRKLDFVAAVAGLAAPGGEARVTELDAAPGRAPRPLDLRLDVSRLESALGRELPTMADGLQRVREDIADG